jgi:hypothetical protein
VIVAVKNTTTPGIENSQELVDAIRGWCPHCRVDSLVETDSDCERMLQFCNASILIGNFEQLSQMVWMKVGDSKKRTSVIEILPYKYTCRERYEQIANGAQIKYSKWMNKHRNNTRTDSVNAQSYAACLQEQIPCRGDCRDLLRVQSTIVHLQEFEGVFRQSLDHVSR